MLRIMNTRSLNSENLSIFDKWILYKLDNVVADFKKYTANYRFDLMANSIYDFVGMNIVTGILKSQKNVE